MTDAQERRTKVLDDAAGWYIALREEPGDPRLRTEFEDWLNSDPEHASAWSSMGRTVLAIDGIPHERRPASPNPLPASRRRERRAPQAAGAMRPRKRWKQAAIGIAAACVAIMAAPTLYLRMTVDHMTETAQVQDVRLPDGSNVLLGPDSAIRLRFSGARRHVDLVAGQAVFDVRPDKARPFEVAAGDVTTQVLGTRFDVRMLPGRIRIGVDHGRVRVVAADVQATLPEVLGAGEWVEIGTGGDARAGRQDAALVGAWQAGKAFVRNRSIAQAIDEIRPWYRGRIILTDRAMGLKPVTGIYDLSDPVEALKLIISPYGGRVVQLSPWLIIVTA